MISYLLPLCLWSLLSPIVVEAYAPCYDVSGQVQGSGFWPCPSHAQSGVSMCCALDRDIAPGNNTDDSYTKDICLSNGLCQNIWANNSAPDRPMVYEYYFDFCTSDTWSSDCLPNVCNVTDDGYGQLTPCADTPHTERWCCGQNETDCCNFWPNHRLAVTLPLTLGKSTSTASSSTQTSSNTPSTAYATTSNPPSSSSVARDSASAGTASPTGSLPSPTSAPSSGLSTGAQAGIGVGVALIGLAVLIGVIFLVRRASQKRRRAELEAPSQPLQASPVYDPKTGDMVQNQAPVYHAKVAPPVEIEAAEARYELSGEHA